MADTRLIDLPAVTALAAGALLYTVVDATTAGDKKITFEDMSKATLQQFGISYGVNQVGQGVVFLDRANPLAPAQPSYPLIGNETMVFAVEDGNWQRITFASWGGPVACNLAFRPAGGTRLAPSATTNNTQFWTLAGWGHDGVVYTPGAFKVSYQTRAYGDWSPTNCGTWHRWHGTKLNETAPAVWMMLLDGIIRLDELVAPTNRLLMANTSGDIRDVDALVWDDGLSKLDIAGDIKAVNAEVAAAGAVLFGDTLTDGSWQLVRSGNDLLIQRLELAAWVTKSTIPA